MLRRVAGVPEKGRVVRTGRRAVREPTERYKYGDRAGDEEMTRRNGCSGESRTRCTCIVA